MLKNEKPAFTLPEGLTDVELLTVVVNHLADRSERMEQADVDLVAPVVGALARRVSPEMRQAAAETLRANGVIPASLIASLSLPRRPRKVIADAVPYTTEQLLAIAGQMDVSEADSNLIVSRGVMEAMVAVLANPRARFAKSSLTTMAELAASDFSLREAMCSRCDLPDSILERLWPYLSLRAKAAVIAEGLTTEKAALQVMIDAAAGDASRQAAADAEAEDYDFAGEIKRLAREGRIVEVARLLAGRAEIQTHLALALLLGMYDRGCVILAHAAGADLVALEHIIDVRAQASARRTPDRRGPIHAFMALKGSEVATLVAGIASLRDDGVQDNAATKPPRTLAVLAA